MKIAVYASVPASSDTATATAALRSPWSPIRVATTPLTTSSGPATTNPAENLDSAIHRRGAGVSAR
jgi:hypothetical protein